MRGLLIVFAGGSALLLLGYWYMSPGVTRALPLQSSSAAPQVTQTNKPKPMTGAGSGGQRQSRQRKQSSTVTREQDQRLPVHASEIVVTVDVGPPPVPTSQDLKTGMRRDDVERAYGAPTLSTTQMHTGTLLQRYVYVDQRRRRTVMAVIEDGRVVSAADSLQ